jgi:hypothetical protein
VEKKARLDRVIAHARTLVFAGAVALAVLVYDNLAWEVLPVVVFIGLVIWHGQVSRARRYALRGAAFYERRLAYLEDWWAGQGVPGTRYLDEKHPCALDLDLFGPASLFELLCTARTRTGEDALAGWLLAPAGLEEVQERQAAVAELRPRLDLREHLALLGADISGGVDLAALPTWGQAPLVPLSFGARIVALGLAALTLVALALWLTAQTGPALLLIALLVEGGFVLALRPRVRQILDAVEKRGSDLWLLSGLLVRLERERFTSPRLQQLRAGLDVAGTPPSVRIAELARLLDWLNARRNLFFAPFAIVTMWTTQVSFAIDTWRRTSGPAIARWLAAVGQFEALSALAGYAYENPADPFPELAADGPCLDGTAIGHPLLPRDRCVRNDVRLGGELRVLVVSGSNMSGKSTLLRTVGINAVLALAGAPVRAERLRVSSLVIGATLRIQDSLQAGRSRFYAEIVRLRQLIDLAKGPVPLLFLLDEILHGTNSHDRRQGAEAVVRTLVEVGAIGLVTTHDLALTHIVDLLGPRAANVHFEDRMEDGAMVFDYHMRPGVVQNSNALALMRAVGIEV